MTELQITEGTVPEKVNNRTARPNPFVGRFPTAEGKAMIVTLPSDTEEEKREVSSVVNLAQEAARAAGFTGRVKREETTIGTGKTAKPGTKLSIWSVPKIVHKSLDERLTDAKASLAEKPDSDARKRAVKELSEQVAKRNAESQTATNA